MNSTNRRHFIRATLSASIATAVSTSATADEKRPPRILLRSSWQTVNIGDIAHTPGVLALLDTHFPDADVRLWPSNVSNGVEEMLRERFPKVQIIRGVEELKTAFSECDFLLHGSGPSLVAEKDVVRWNTETGKPYGVFGITFSKTGSTATKPTSNASLAKTINVLSRAEFVFFRDSVSLELARSEGCSCPRMQFGPDGAFATDLSDDAFANHVYRQQHPGHLLPLDRADKQRHHVA